MITAILGTLVVLVVIGVLFWIDELDRPLPKPKHDERNWSINYMTDFKRWSGRG